MELKELMSVQAEARNMKRAFDKGIYPHDVYILINRNDEQSAQVYAIKANETLPKNFHNDGWIPYDSRFYDFENLYCDKAKAAREFIKASANAIRTGIITSNRFI